MALKIQNKFDIEQKVYVITDPDQNTHIITGIIIQPGNILLYKAACGCEVGEYYDFELSADKNVI